MKNIQLSSPETDRKIARPASIIFMSVAWLAFAGLLTWTLFSWKHSEHIHWGIFAGWVGFLLVPLLLIPIQLVRYFREK